MPLISDLTRLSTIAGRDLLYVSERSGNTYVSKGITVNNLFANVTVNTAINGTFTVSANTTLNGANVVVTANLNSTGITNLNQLTVANNQLRLTTSQTPANSTITKLQGNIFYDSSYIYLATANNTIKRVALTTF